jgi:flagellin-specific chaperone FliS
MNKCYKNLSKEDRIIVKNLFFRKMSEIIESLRCNLNRSKNPIWNDRYNLPKNEVEYVYDEYVLDVADKKLTQMIQEWLINSKKIKYFTV